MFPLLTTLIILPLSLAAAERVSPYKLGSISTTPSLDLFRRQDAGYSPTTTFCTPGTSCASSCGATYIQCLSTDSILHCYDPTIKRESCCSDGTGNSCADGYFCTADTSGDTWCCPNGMDLLTCAAAYTLTDTLISEPVTAAPTSIATFTPVATDVAVTASYNTSAYTAASSAYATGTLTAGTDATTSAPFVQVTGAADRMAGLERLSGLVVVVGVLLVL